MANTTNKGVQERLAQIAAAVAAKTQSQSAQSGPTVKIAQGFVCPSDPAERAACDSCQ